VVSAWPSATTGNFEAMLAFITGSGFYKLDALHQSEAETVNTPYGPAEITRGRWKGGTEVLFLPRHGANHTVAPHMINYRANVWALQAAGATAIAATAVSGAIADDLSPGDFVVIDDFIDYTHGRAATFFDAAAPSQVPMDLTAESDVPQLKVKHTDMASPYDRQLRALLAEAAESARVPISIGGTYCATNGPRFETKAEIAMMKIVGGDLVGMTGCPEVVLANELGLPYASIGVISNKAAGRAVHDFTVADIMQVLDDATWPLELLLGALIERHAA